ncbi:hypothetical protein ACFYT4_17125 [Streptomyces sp. NPDC004609]|uniref:hypothetical protein n=1 Tax=Streptomyces sp. NPDC004609 TaxID=3364704 RepID=UPI0036C9F92F
MRIRSGGLVETGLEGGDLDRGRAEQNDGDVFARAAGRADWSEPHSSMASVAVLTAASSFPWSSWLWARTIRQKPRVRAY